MPSISSPCFHTGSFNSSGILSLVVWPGVRCYLTNLSWTLNSLHCPTASPLLEKFTRVRLDQRRVQIKRKCQLQQSHPSQFFHKAPGEQVKPPNVSVSPRGVVPGAGAHSSLTRSPLKAAENTVIIGSTGCSCFRRQNLMNTRNKTIVLDIFRIHLLISI